MCARNALGRAWAASSALRTRTGASAGRGARARGTLVEPAPPRHSGGALAGAGTALARIASPAVRARTSDAGSCSV